MKVLFLTFAYPPKKFPRSIQISHLVNYLKNFYTLTIITYPFFIEGGDKSLLEFTSLSNVETAPKSKLTDWIERAKGSRLKQAILPDSYYFWHFDLYRKALEFIDREEPKVVVTFGQPMSSHLAGVKIKKQFPDIKWIAHFSDPWIDNSFNKYNWWTRFLNTRYQNKVIKKADQLIFTSQETISLVMKNYSYDLKKKVVFRPHCFNEELYPKTWISEKQLIIRYLGNFYGDRQPDFLFAALKSMTSLDNVRIELIGASTVSIEAEIMKQGLEKLVFPMKAVPYLESLNLMKQSDILLILDAPSEESPFLPSKLVDYIGANKPIFGITPIGTSQRLIEEMGFPVANPINVNDIKEKLASMISEVRSGKSTTIPPSVRNRFQFDVVGNEWIESIKQLF